MPTTYTYGSLQFCNGDGTSGYYCQGININAPQNITTQKIPRNDINKINDDGLAPVEIQVNLIVAHKTSIADFDALMKALHQYLNAGASDLYLDVTTKHYRNVYCKGITSQHTDRSQKMASVSFPLVTADPFYYYDTTINSPNNQTPNANPFTWTITTSGIAYVEPVILVTGPFTGNILLESLTRSEWIQLAASLGPGATLEIDSANRTVKQNGTESYTNITNDNASGGFLKLNAGANNMQLTLGGAPTTGTVVTTWTDRDFGGY
jgi:phage-related protein